MSRTRLREQQTAGNKDPVFTWSLSGDLVSVTYSGGAVKSFFYDAQGRVERVDMLQGGVVYRRNFTYNPDGSLALITDVEL